MFTGIVEELGTLESVDRVGDSARLRIRGPLVTSDAGHGDSIAVNGVCLTVTEFTPGQTFDADVMAETLDRTALGALAPGDGVNLERAMRADARFGGHIVQGHVDGTGRLLTRVDHEHWQVARFSLPADLDRYVVAKGSITVSGTSLTVSAVSGPGESVVRVSLIPRRWNRPSSAPWPRRSGQHRGGRLAKYVERLLDGRGGNP